MQRSTFTYRDGGVTLRVAGPVDEDGPVTLAIEATCGSGWRVRWRVDPATLRPLPATFTRHGRRTEPSRWQRKQMGMAAAWETAGDLLREAADELPPAWGLVRRDLGRLGGRTQRVDAQEVERLRVEQGMSESEIANVLGVTRGAVSNARGRAGTRTPRAKIKSRSRRAAEKAAREAERRNGAPTTGTNPFAD